MSCEGSELAKTGNRLRGDVKATSLMVSMLLVIAIAITASIITYSWVMSMMAAQSQKAQTRIMIELMEWDVPNNELRVKVRNTGSIFASITSIGIVENNGLSSYDMTTIDPPVTIQVQDSKFLTWNGALQLQYSNSYVIRVTCSSGFIYEVASSTPAS